MEAKKTLAAGVVRTDCTLSDGRTIRYYDTHNQTRTAVDQRPVADQPVIGEMRHDPLLNEWVTMAAHRQTRIFLPPQELNPLAPSRAGFLTEIPEPDYEVVVFDNRSPSFRPPDSAFTITGAEDLFPNTLPAAGKCEVICYTSDYEASFKDLSHSHIRTILEAWRDRVSELSKEEYIQVIFPFENRGEEVGVTLNHPHGQIYAYPFITPRVEKMLDIARRYQEKTGRVLFDDVLAREIKDQVRIIVENQEWLAFVPYASRYPFEIHVTPKRPVADLAGLDEKQCALFAPIAKEVLTRLDGVFGIKMAYIASWHQAPVRVGRDILRLHWQITSVRRAPGKLKYLAGSESQMGAFIMDMKPEQSAAQLLAVKIE